VRCRRRTSPGIASRAEAAVKLAPAAFVNEGMAADEARHDVVVRLNATAVGKQRGGKPFGFSGPRGGFSKFGHQILISVKFAMQLQIAPLKRLSYFP
jgi:hypothetical protein